MKIRNYLIVKCGSGARPEKHDEFMQNYFDENHNFKANDFFDANPDEASWAPYIGDDEIWRNNLRMRRQSYVPKEGRDYVNNLNNTYNTLTNQSGTTVDTQVIPDARRSGYVDYNDKIQLTPDASIYTLLHEKGHANDVKSGNKIRGDNQVQLNATKLFGDYKIYKQDDLQNLLRSEQAASDYARNVVSKIQDPAVRERAQQQLEAELKPAYDTYDSYYGELLRANNKGSGIGGIGGGLLGGLGMGAGAYMLANRLANNSNMTGWKKGLLTIGAGLLSGALGTWLGHRFGSNLGGSAGQLWAQYKNNRNGYMTNNHQQALEQARAARKANQDIGYLNDYLQTNK